MAEEGAPFLAVVPAQERELPETSQPANPEAANHEVNSLAGADAETVTVAPPSEVKAEVQSKEGESKKVESIAESMTRPARTNLRKTGAKEPRKTGEAKTPKAKAPKIKTSKVKSAKTKKVTAKAKGQ